MSEADRSPPYVQHSGRDKRTSFVRLLMSDTVTGILLRFEFHDSLRGMRNVLAAYRSPARLLGRYTIRASGPV